MYFSSSITLPPTATDVATAMKPWQTLHWFTTQGATHGSRLVVPGWGLRTEECPPVLRLRNAGTEWADTGAEWRAEWRVEDGWRMVRDTSGISRQWTLEPSGEWRMGGGWSGHNTRDSPWFGCSTLKYGLMSSTLFSRLVRWQQNCHRLMCGPDSGPRPDYWWGGGHSIARCGVKCTKLIVLRPSKLISQQRTL